MTENTINPRAERLKKFIEFTGMTAREFAKQCELKSITSILSVTNKNQQPTDKLLKAIIKRFPQLSYDWIILGSGNMLVTGSDDMQSIHSADISTNARNNQINSKLEMHDYSLNELNNRINDSMSNIDRKADIISEMITTMNIKVDKIVFDAKQYVEEHAKQNEKGMEAALEMITGFNKRSNAMMTKIEKMMDTIVKSQNRADARSDESLKAGLALVDSINKTREKGMEMIIAVQKEMKQQAKLAEEATELGYRALKENKEALKSFGKGLEGYAKERDKKAREITLHNVEKLFKELLEQKGLGTYTKVKKS